MDSHLLAVAVVVPSGSAARTLSRQSSAKLSQSDCTPEHVPALPNALVNFASALASHAVSSEGSPKRATFARHRRKRASRFAMALSFALVHWSAAAGPAASSKQAKTVETTVNRRVTGLAIPDTYDPATRQVNQKFGILLESRRSRSAGRTQVDAELEGDDGAREAHQRRLPVDVEERGRLPVGKALADEQRQADWHLRKAAPHAEDARGGGDGEEPASAAQQLQGHGGRRRIVGRLGVGVEGLRGDGGAQRDIEGPQQDVGDRASQRVRPRASRVRHPRRGESNQQYPYRMPPHAYPHDATLPLDRATRVSSFRLRKQGLRGGKSGGATDCRTGPGRSALPRHGGRPAGDVATEGPTQEDAARCRPSPPRRPPLAC